MKRYDHIDNHPDQIGWKKAHMAALFNTPVGLGLQAWTLYQKRFKAHFGFGIGEDRALRDHWAEWGLGLMGLLDGITDGLDCGSVWKIIHENLLEEGFDTDTRKWKGN